MKVTSGSTSENVLPSKEKVIVSISTSGVVLLVDKVLLPASAVILICGVVEELRLATTEGVITAGTIEAVLVLVVAASAA